MPAISKIALIILTIAYPAAVYIGLQLFDVRYLVILLLMVGGVRMLSLGKTPLNHWLWLPLLGLLGLWTWVGNTDIALKLYPVIVNMLMLCLFTWSLWYPPSMIERFARIKDKNLPAAAISYTRKLTIIWCGFFIVNGCIALATALYASDEIWALYNGLIAYIAMSLLLAGEYLYRYYFVNTSHE